MLFFLIQGEFKKKQKNKKTSPQNTKKLLNIDHFFHESNATCSSSVFDVII